jgi:hypothetical protein
MYQTQTLKSLSTNICLSNCYSNSFEIDIAADGSRGGERVVLDIEKRGGRQFIYSGHTDSHDYDAIPRPGDQRPRPDNRFPTELINTKKEKKRADDEE